MRLVLDILALCLAITICSQQVSAAPHIPVSTLCCERHIRRPLALSRIVGYIKVHSTFDCPRAAVIFKTVADRLVCANPEHQWVQERVRGLDQKVQHD